MKRSGNPALNRLTAGMIGDHPSSIQPQVFHVDRKEISYLRFTLESYDGMAVVTTLDPYTALIEVSIAPGCEEIVFELLNSLKNEEGLRIKKVPKVKELYPFKLR